MVSIDFIRRFEEFTPQLINKLLTKIESKDIGIHILNTNDSDLKNFTNTTYINLVLQAYKHYKPEAVFVMSNQDFTVDMINALKQNGIKTYGATFDS